MSSSEVSPEVQELNELLAVAKLPAVRKVLEDAVASFSAQHSTAPAAATPTAPAVVGMPPPVAAAVKPAQPSTETKYEHVTWGWDSGDKFVSVYITVPKLKKTDKEKVKCDFTTSSFDVIVSDVEGKNYRLSKSNLDKDIKPEDSKVRVKDGRVVLLLAKVNSWDYWTDLVSKTKRSASSGNAASADGGIMDMMKQMYDSGDDNMKRVIGQAWEKSQKERMMGGGMGGGGAAGMPDMGGLGDEDLAF